MRRRQNQAGRGNRAGRQRAERRGRLAETLAALFLWVKGYRVLDRRARTPYGEVDIVALKGAVLAIVEVKARADAAQGLYAISATARRRIGLAGLAVAQRLRRPGLRLRFDVIIVTGGLGLTHVRDAWRSDDPRG